MHIPYVLDTKTMEMHMLPDMDSGIADLEDGDEELLELIENDDTHRFLRLPTEYDIHEYRIMEEFIGDLEDEKLARLLGRAIHGRGAFRRFKNILLEQDRIEDWIKYKDRYYWKLARTWCKANNLNFIDDEKKHSRY